MDIVIGTIFWGGLLWLMLAWLTHGNRPKAQHRAPGRASRGAWRSTGTVGAPAPPTARQLPPAEQQRRVDDALVDGLVIGHFLTRDHYRRRIGALEDSIDELGPERGPWLDDGLGDDHLEAGTDDAEFDAMGGFGVEPWADDLVDIDDD
jgi:hypothetical protein